MDNISCIESYICLSWFQDFIVEDGLLIYSKYLIVAGELKEDISSSFQKAVLHEFHDNTLADHLRNRKTNEKISSTCYFLHMRKDYSSVSLHWQTLSKV